MWRVACVGPGPGGQPRRVTDRGPLFPTEDGAQRAAAWLQATGLYERVTVEKTVALRKSADDAHLLQPG